MERNKPCRCDEAGESAGHVQGSVVAAYLVGCFDLAPSCQDAGGALSQARVGVVV